MKGWSPNLSKRLTWSIAKASSCLTPLHSEAFCCRVRILTVAIAGRIVWVGGCIYRLVGGAWRERLLFLVKTPTITHRNNGVLKCEESVG
ncbi:hypothetical protein Hanom_Chr15g01391341 [Helianthus anomalus]